MFVDAILPKLDAIAHGLLPAHERSDRRLVARARFGCAVIGIFLLIALIRVPMLVSNGAPRSQAVVLGVCAMLALIAPAIPRVAGSFTIAAHLIVLLTLLPLVSLIHNTGGSGSPALLVLIITPMIAVFLTGARGGIGWSLVIGAIVCLYAFLDRLGLSPPILFPPETWKLEKSIGAFLLTMIVLGLALSYERSRQIAENEAVRASLRAEQAQQAQQNADERVVATEASHRQSLEWLSQSFAHEANNTLAYVMGDLALLGDQPAADQSSPTPTSTRNNANANTNTTSSATRTAPMGDAARLGAERLRHIVRDVQTIAAGDTDPHEDCVATDLSRLVNDVVDELTPLLRGLGIEIQRRARAQEEGPAPLYALAVPSRLARCVASSLIAFTPETKIDIALERRDDRPAILITARQGALEARPLAYEAIRRALASFGGALVITPGVETATVTIHMELQHADPPRRITKAVVTETEAKKLRVLLVDDEALILRVTKRLLSDFDVTTTSSPREALEELRSRSFDIVLCDFNMPEMRGDSLFTKAIALGFDPTRFIVMTGGSFDEVEAAFGEHSPLMLAKPYTRNELQGIIRRASSM